jgi:hypothetical protein
MSAAIILGILTGFQIFALVILTALHTRISRLENDVLLRNRGLVE